MTPNGQIAIPLDTAAIREPFGNECKGALCDAPYGKAISFYTVSAIREPSPSIARACYLRSIGALKQNRWVKYKMAVICIYEASRASLI